MPNTDEFGFELVEVPTDHLSRRYSLRWKALPVTDGPTDYKGGQYISIAVRFEATTGETRPEGYFDYGLHRERWAIQNPFTATEGDYDRLRELVLARLPDDLHEVDSGRAPESLRPGSNELPLFLS